MFAHWRKLAAAAAAFCFPISFLHASLQSDEPLHTRSAPCVRAQAATEETWFRNERETWYERYYGNELNESTSATLLPIQPLDSEQPGVIIDDIELFDATLDGSIITDASNPCDELTCPCHEITDQDYDATAVTPSTDWRGVAKTARKFEIESDFFNVHAPYLVGDEIEILPSESEPTAKLTGTIEPIFEDCEAAWWNECYGNEAYPVDTNIKLNSIEPLEPSDSDEFGEDGEFDEGSRDYHMFYPGCDWNPYYPASRSGPQPKLSLPEDVRSA